MTGGILHKNTTFTSALYAVRTQLCAYDLESCARQPRLNNANLTLWAARSRRKYNFPALASGAPLLVDERMGFPVTLPAVLRTAAMYQSMNWELPYTRRYTALEFFRLYSQALLKPALKLALQGLGLQLELSNLVININNGNPSSVHARRLQGYSCQQPLPGSDFSELSSPPQFYNSFITALLQSNLRPMIANLVELSGAKAEVFWDYAIETMLEALQPASSSVAALDVAMDLVRQHLFVDELSLEGRLTHHSVLTNKALTDRPIIFLKSRCCEKYRKNNRCFACPGLKKLSA